MRIPADNREVRRILRALTIGKIKRTIEDGPTTLEKYGLDPPYLTLTLKTPTTTQQIALGDRGPFAPSLYVQTKDDNQVVLTTLDVMTFAQKTLTDFRLKDLLLFERERVHEVHIQQADSTMIMTREAAGVHSLSPHWMFTSPMKAPADKIVVGTLLMDLSGLTATGFVDSEEETTTDSGTIRVGLMSASQYWKDHEPIMLVCINFKIKKKPMPSHPARARSMKSPQAF